MCDFNGRTPTLNELLGNKPWKWTESCEKSYHQLKQAVTTNTVLAHYDPRQKLELAVDASHYGLGAVIMHVTSEGKHRPIAFASRNLNK